MINQKQKRLGAVYTPRRIVDMILDGAGLANAETLANARICDPACGDGAFLTAAAERALNLLPKKDALRTLRRLTGCDINPAAVNECRVQLDALLKKRHPKENVNWRLRVCNAFNRSELQNEWGRFTHVVGNPPYIRIQRLEEEGRGLIDGQWKTMRGAYDSYLLFFELGLELLREGGTLAYIAPSSWLRSRAGRNLRAMLAQSHAVTRLIDFQDEQAFEGVSTYTAVAFIQKGGETRRIPVHLGGGTLAYIDIDKADLFRPWTALTPKDKARMETLKQRGPQLGSVADIHVGIQTLADSVFILPIEPNATAPTGRAACRTQNETLTLERWILRPIVKASVMKNGEDPVQRALIYPYDPEGRLLPETRIAEKAPAAYAWLKRNKERLLNRDKGKTDPERWHAFGRSVSILTAFGGKILTSAMNRRPNFQICANPNAAFYSGYCVKPKAAVDTRRLINVLNSDDMEFYIRRIGQPYQNGWMSYAKSYIQTFPVPWSLIRHER
ncbi:MAG: N-6 DNA methylase [Candidatus Poribacteria bacterium]|nr:N-6 DNA methylase [Candidatus Poribacteria bacterium]